MSSEEVETLVVVLAEGGEVGTGTLGVLLARGGADLRSPHPYARSRLEPLARGGAVEKVGHGRWALTEKGRIAAALTVARDPGLREVFLEDDG